MHNPGLKPWAVLYSRFAAKIRQPQKDDSSFQLHLAYSPKPATIFIHPIAPAHPGLR